MTVFFLDWLELIFRWMHLLVGVAWIGSSLHYVKVDRSLVPDPNNADIKGRFWAIHGGGVYQFKKYHLAPPEWPETLHWSKWEAYSTWLTGMALMVLVYYLQADLYLMTNSQNDWSTSHAVLSSLGLIGISMGIYEGLIRSALAQREVLFAGLIALLIVLLVWVATWLFPGRAAFIHVGVILGSIMVGNVYFGIIPAQKTFVSAIKQGIDPDFDVMLAARHRSFFNNYLTLPVLLCMVSLHFSTLYQHSLNFAALSMLMLAGALGRHFFNLRHLHITHWRYLGAAGLIIFVVMVMLMPPSPGSSQQSSATVVPPQLLEPNAIDALTEKHCGNCHADQPSQPGFAAAPAGLVIRDHRDLLRYRVRSSSAIGSGYMPLANLTQLTAAERTDLMNFLLHASSDSDHDT
jgi:uncharacterized membrane protein